MKHNKKVTIILIAMFFLTQLIGLAIINGYAPRQTQFLNETTGEIENVTKGVELPYGLEAPEVDEGVSFGSIIFAFVLAIFLILLLMKIKAKLILRMWFFFVVILALSLAFYIIFFSLNLEYASLFAFLVALPLAIFKVFKKNIIVHNFTELLIYPGISIVFIPLLGIWSIIILLLLISVYDIYAVWHAGFMQKMAKYQINEVGVFGGFFVPYVDKKTRKKMKELKKKYKNNKDKLKNKKINVNLAILGGGDVVFPLILAGVVLHNFGILYAFIISVFATLSLAYLLLFSKKGKFYPAMPYLTTGCFIGLALVYFLYRFI